VDHLSWLTQHSPTNLALLLLLLQAADRLLLLLLKLGCLLSLLCVLTGTCRLLERRAAALHGIEAPTCARPKGEAYGRTAAAAAVDCWIRQRGKRQITPQVNTVVLMSKPCI
jgi:hypothetical protein